MVRWLAAALGWTVAALVATVLAASAFTRAPWGASRLAGLAERVASAQLAGEISIGTLWIAPWGVRIRDVFIVDHRGAPTIAAREVDVALDPLALLFGRLRVHDLLVRGGLVEVAFDPVADDVGIGQAFAPRHPGPEEPPAPRRRFRPLPPGAPFPIELRRLRVEDVAFRLAESPAGPPDILVRGIGAEAEGSWDDDARVTVRLTGDAAVPVAAPLAVRVDASFARDLLEAGEVVVSLGRTRLRVDGLGQMRVLDGAVRLEGVAGAPEARAFGIPLAEDVRVGADFLLSRERIVGAFRASVPDRGVVVGEARLSPEDGTIHGRAVIEALDPAAWLPGPPPGELSGVVALEGDLTPTPRLAVEAALPPGRLAGARIGPGRLIASLEGGTVRIEEGWAVIPGAGVSVVGLLGPEAVDLAATVKARDLARTHRFLAALGLEAPALAGAGTLRATARGDPRRPALALRLAAPRLRVGGVRASDLRLRGGGRLGRDGLPVLQLTGRAARLDGGRFRGTRVRLFARREEGGAFELRARSGEGAGRYALAAAGHLGRDGAVVERFRFRYPEGVLRLEAPVAIEPGDDTLKIRGLRLSGPGRITGELALGRGGLDLDLTARKLRLDRLPQALVPADLSGVVDLRARVEGPLRRPEGRVRFRVADGRYGTLGGLGASGNVRLAGRRAAGRVAVELRGAGVVRGDFDVPLDPLAAPGSAPFRLDLRGAPIGLAEVGAALGVELPRGTFRFRLAGSGTVGAPRLHLETQALDVVLPGRVLPAADAALAVTVEEGLATVDLEGRVTGRTVLRLDAAAPLDLRRVLADPAGQARALLHSPVVRVEAEARGLDLAFVARLLGQPDVSGPVAAVVDLGGPLVDPRGRVRVDVAARSLGALDRVEGTLEAELGDRRTRLDGRVSLDGGPTSSLAVAVDAPLTGLLDGTAPAATPVKLSVDIPELRLRRFSGGAATARAAERAAARPGGLLRPIPSPDRPGPAARLSGTIEGGGSFEGTLARLRGSLRVVGRNLALGAVALGDVELSVRQDEDLEARLDAIDPTAGTLTATARVDTGISPLGFLRDGLPAVGALPAVVTVEGAALSLAPLRLVDAIAEASGQVAIEVGAEGPLARLAPRGRVALDEGRVELASGQTLEGIALLAAFEGDRLELRQLVVRTPGRGHLDAEGTLALSPGADALSLEAHAEEFPIGGPGGVTARLTGNVEAEGTFGGLRDGFRAQVVLPDLRVELPRRPPREVQAIARHRDVVVVTGPEAQRRIRKSRVQAEERAIPVQIEVRAPDVRVEGEDASARLTANLTLSRAPDGELVAHGQVRSERGRLRALGRFFELERAVVRFDGPLDRPYVDATARHDGREATAWVDVVGPADDPQLRLRSDPPLPESQIAVLIASGRIPEGSPQPVGAVGEETPPTAGVEAGGAAASIAGSFLAGQLRQAIGSKLPLDVLVLESGGAGGPRIEAGTFLGERLYLGYLRDLLPEDGENLNEIRAEYELSRSFSLESFYGDAATGGVDLVFERAVPTGSQVTARREAAAAAAVEPRVEPGRAPAAFPPRSGDGGDRDEPGAAPR